MRRRSAASIAVTAALLAACGADEEGSPSDSVRACVAMWDGEHPGSTNLQYLGKTHPKIAARVERSADGGCQVEYATPDHEVYGRLVQRDGTWSLAADRGSAEQAENVVDGANAHARPDGGLDIGAP